MCCVCGVCWGKGGHRFSFCFRGVAELLRSSFQSSKQFLFVKGGFEKNGSPGTVFYSCSIFIYTHCTKLSARSAVAENIRHLVFHPGFNYNSAW
jgi:hypothetical protein